MKIFLQDCLILMMASAEMHAQDTVYFNRQAAEPVEGGTKNHRSKEKNIIKIAPLSFISGYIPVYYEREITPFLSLQAGLGITSRNYLKEWTTEIAQSDNIDETIAWNAPASGNDYNALSRYGYAHRKPMMGYFFSLQPKIFVSSEGLEGSFIGISYDYFHYARNQQKIEKTSGGAGPVFAAETFSEHEKISDVSAWFGIQSLYDRIAVEYAIGAGLRNINGQHYAYADRGSEYIDGVAHSKQTKLSLNISIKIGYHY